MVRRQISSMARRMSSMSQTGRSRALGFPMMTRLGGIASGSLVKLSRLAWEGIEPMSRRTTVAIVMTLMVPFTALGCGRVHYESHERSSLTAEFPEGLELTLVFLPTRMEKADDVVVLDSPHHVRFELRGADGPGAAVLKGLAIRRVGDATPAHADSTSRVLRSVEEAGVLTTVWMDLMLAHEDYVISGTLSYETPSGRATDRPFSLEVRHQVRKYSRLGILEDLGSV